MIIKSFTIVSELSQIFSGLKIQEKREGFDRLIIIPKGLTIQRMYKACYKHFYGSEYEYVADYHNLDEVVITNDRDPNNGAYAIWIRERIEADKELKNLSANDLRARGIKGITLFERLVYEAKYFKETGRRLDIKSITLCSGSRDILNCVPTVTRKRGIRRFGWEISWRFPSTSHSILRAREVIC